ncbi:MAG: hypothetical protein DBX55_05110 [Verrucomicrobia bacterium]|nr:MAG: hypothetical protein DBX55_05110 [Verrucomicrobiota bacterium]
MRFILYKGGLFQAIKIAANIARAPAVCAPACGVLGSFPPRYASVASIVYVAFVALLGAFPIFAPPDCVSCGLVRNPCGLIRIRSIRSKICEFFGNFCKLQKNSELANL